MRHACIGKILDIFEGTQQIQQLIIARKLLGKISTELKQPRKVPTLPRRSLLGARTHPPMRSCVARKRE